MKPAPEKSRAAILRAKAEAQLKKQNSTRLPQSEDQVRRLQQELEVHQIELEMQNEELRAAAAETALALDQFTELYDFAPAGYFTLTEDGTIRQLNLTGAQFLGVARSHLIGASFRLLVAEGDRKTFSHFIAQVFGSPEIQHLQLPLLPKSGPPLIARLEARRDAAGTRCRMVAIDVTAQVQAERLTKETLALNQSILAGIPNAMEIVDLTGNILFQNEAMIKAVDRPVLGQKCWEVYADNRQQCAHCPLKQPLGIGELKTTEVGGVLGGRTFEIHHVGIEYQGRPAVMELFHDITERQRAEEQLREQEESYRTLADSGRALIWTAGTDKKCDYFNQPWLKFTGRTREQELGDGWAEGVHPDDLARCFKIYAEAFDRRESFSMDYRLRHHTGEFRWIQDDGTPRHDRRGNFLGYIGHCIDITERKQAELLLRDQESQYRDLFESASDALLLLDESGRVLDANQMAAQFYGYERDELLTKKNVDLSAEPEETGRRTQEARTQPDQVFFIPHRLHRRKNGTVFPVEITSRSLIRKGQKILLVACRDITERKRAEEELRKSRADFHGYFENSSVGNCVTSMAKGWIEVNERLCQMLGYTKQELARFTWEQLTHPDDLAADVELFNQVVAGKRDGYELDKRFIRKDGSMLYATLTVACQRRPDGAPDYFLSSLLDITERKQMEAVQSFLAQSNTGTGGEPFFNALAAFLAENLRMDFVCIDVLEGDGLNARTLAVWHDGKFEDNVTYALKDTPCGDVVGQQVCCFTAGVTKLFPEDQVLQDLRAESYAGVTLWSHDGKPIGLIAVISRKPLANRSQVEAALKIVAGRAAGELERQVAETALQESESQFRAMFELASIGMAQSDPSTRRWLGVNNKMLAITGYSAAELLEMRIPDITHSEDRQKDTDAFQMVVRGEIPEYRMEKRYLRKDGAVVWVNVNMTIIRDAAGQPVRTMATIEDITERKRAEELHLRLATAVEQAAEAIIITDVEGTIIYVNPAFENISGYTRAEAMGQNPRILKSGKQDGAFYRQMWEAIQRGETWSGRFINQRKDGTLYEEESTITPIRDKAGKVINYVAVERDVTHEVELEGQLRQSQKMEAMGTLAGGIAHDFNNILNVIFGYCNLLQLDLAGKRDELEKVGEILKAGERAKELVQQILTFSRRQEQERLVIHLNTVIKETIKLLRASLPANLEIETKLAAEAPMVLADATQIYQVIMNLGTNAMHAMEKQATGRLTIALDAFEPDAALLKRLPELRAIQYARLTISDTGCGMDAVTLARIYDPFFTTKPVGKGTGLGLAVVHGIVEAHEGVIAVESKPGQGTTFRIYLPAQISDRLQDGIPEDLIPCGQGQRILMVDDEVALVGMYQKLFKALKYEGTIVTDPEEAISLVRKHPEQYELVITDLTMPGMSGMEVARQIRAIREDLPVILATGFHGTVSDRQLTAAGICEVLEKPILMGTLAMVLRGILGKKPED